MFFFFIFYNGIIYDCIVKRPYAAQERLLIEEKEKKMCVCVVVCVCVCLCVRACACNDSDGW